MRIFILIYFLFIQCINIYAQDSLNVRRVFQWKDDSLTVNTANSRYNEVWGFVHNNREYAVIGSTYGTHFFDITDIDNVRYVDSIQGRFTGDAVVHRDFHDYNGYLYAVGDQGSASLQIMDLSYLPDSVSLVYDEDSILINAHNIFIDTPNAKLYVCGGEHRFAVVDISNPIVPELLVSCPTDIPWWASSVDYVHDVYVENNIAFCNGEDGLYIVDFTDAFNPILLSSNMSYPDQGYNHSGWLHSSGNYYALADETHGKRIKLMSVDENYQTQTISLFNSGLRDRSIVHNLIFRDNYLYASHYHDGLYIFDCSDPNNVITAGYYRFSDGYMSNFYGAWGVYPLLPSGNILLSDMQKGLFVFQADVVFNNITNKQQFIVGPNPFVNYINIYNPNLSTHPTELELFNSIGQMVYKENISSNEYHQKLNILSPLPAGIYYLSIKSGDISQKIKMLKQ